jgi:hypothetical protein
VITAILGAAALVLGVVVWLVGERHASDSSDQLDRVLASARLNEQQADTASKQQVVNGWTARDLLALLNEQQADQTRLTGLVGVVIGLAGAAVVVGLLLVPGRRARRGPAPLAPPFGPPASRASGPPPTTGQAPPPPLGPAPPNSSA